MLRIGVRTEYSSEMIAMARHSRDHQRHRLVQTMLAFAVAIFLAVCLSAAAGVHARAAIGCTARSIATASDACSGAPASSR